MRDVVTVKGDASFIAASAVDKIYSEMEKIQGPIVFSFPGGRSIKNVVEQFASHTDQFSSWDRVHIFCTDERLVARDDPQSNFPVVKDAVLAFKQAGMPDENLHWFIGNSPDIPKAMELYDKELTAVGGKVHFLFLGAGEDGHVASLFPRSKHLSAKESKLLHIEDAPKPPPNRISLSPEHIRQALLPVLLFIGNGKKDAYTQFLDESASTDSCPAKLALEGSGSLLLLTDLEMSSF